MLRIFLITVLLASAAFGQAETVNNLSVIEMSRAQLSAEIILRKIASSRTSFDVSSQSLIELKKAGVDESVITAMMERYDAMLPGEKLHNSPPGLSRGADANSPPGLRRGPDANSPPSKGGVAPASGDGVVPDGVVMTNGANGTVPLTEKPPIAATRQQAVATAKTIAFSKSSIHPSTQALEKELMKRKDFQKLNLTMLRYKEHADLFVEIGFVSGSWITHRYVYRIYEKRSGAVIGAGETTSWGSLAENLARNIANSLKTANSGKPS